MTIPAPPSYLPLGSYIAGTVTDDGTAITLLGADTPEYMFRLIIYGHYECWATESLSSYPGALTRMVWLVTILSSTAFVKGRILETALITPDDVSSLYQLADRLCQGNAGRGERPAFP